MTDDVKEESTESPSDTLRATTPVDTSAEIKTDVSDVKTETPLTDEPIKKTSSESEDNLVDVEDSDDYLLHLETILKTIHTRFYSYYMEHEKVICQ